MLVFLLGSAAVALAFVPVLISSPNKPTQISKKARNVTQPVHAICSVLTSGLCFYFVMKKKSWKRTGRVIFIDRTDRQTEASRRYSYNSLDNPNLKPRSIRDTQLEVPMLDMIVFGIGACLWLMCAITSNICFNDHFAENYANLVSSVDICIYFFSIIIQMIFLAGYAGAILPNDSLFHYSIALMVADKIWVWLTVTLGDLVEVSSEHHNKIPSYPIHHMGNINNNFTSLNKSSETTLYKVLEVSIIFLEPFFIEFLTISIGVLFHLWHLIGNVQKHNRRLGLAGNETTETDPNERLQDYSFLINENLNRNRRIFGCGGSDLAESEGNSLLKENQHDIRIRSMKETFFLGIFITFILLIAVGSFIAELFWNNGPFHKLEHHLSNETQYYLFRGIQIVSFFPMTLMAVVSIYKTYKKNACWSSSFTSSDYLLFFTAAANFIWNILRLIAAATVLDITSDEFQRKQAEFVLIFAIACVVEVWVQTQLLLSAESVHRLGRPNSKLTRMCLFYVAVINISIWLQMAISRGTIIHEATSFIPVLTDCFGEVTTRTLVFLFFPAMELYRFHSAVVAYEILK